MILMIIGIRLSKSISVLSDLEQLKDDQNVCNTYWIIEMAERKTWRVI